MPRYLSWVINHFPQALQHHISSSGVSAMPIINLGQLGEVELPIPSLETQCRIIEGVNEIESARTLVDEYFMAASKMLRGLARKYS